MPLAAGPLRFGKKSGNDAQSAGNVGNFSEVSGTRDNFATFCRGVRRSVWHYVEFGPTGVHQANEPQWRIGEWRLIDFPI